VLVDDLVSKGTAEPYRLFTSLAEFRLLLRQDNADLRLMDLGRELGLLAPEVHSDFVVRRLQMNLELERLERTWLKPSAALNRALMQLESSPVEDSVTLSTLLRRPEIRWKDLGFLESSAGVVGLEPVLERSVSDQVEIQTKYDGYIRRQLTQVEQFKKLEERRLPEDLDYSQVHGLSQESRQKLQKLRPVSIGQASRISGVTPADVSVLLVCLEARRRSAQPVLTVQAPDETGA
jgi:tRNA uridine 5-carboxymethylaminomethyl modification enzyme